MLFFRFKIWNFDFFVVLLQHKIIKLLMMQSIIQRTIASISLSLTAVLGYCQTVEKDNNVYLYTKTTGEAEVYSIDEISKITFSENGVQIWNTNWPTEYSYSTVRVLTFDSEILPVGGGGTSSETTGEMKSITISSAKQLAYYSDKALDFSDYPDLKAYVATGYAKSGIIWLTRVKQVSANTGFLLMGNPGEYDIPVIAGDCSTYYKNLFKGTLKGTTIQTTEDGYTNYYLSKGDYGVSFYKVGASGVKLGTNRAYLSVPSDIPAIGTAGGTETIKVSAALQVPYYSANSLDFTDMESKGLKAYTATGYDYAKGTIWLSRVKQVPAETGILIMVDKAGDYDVPKASVASVYENMFMGTLGGKTIQTEETIAGEDYINYYLSKGDYGISFYKVGATGVTLGENRCYLAVPVRKSSASGTRSFSSEADQITIQESDEVIGIPLYRGIESDEDGTTGVKEVKSGEVKSDEWFTLQGQRVAKPGKGLYIRNGKKVIVR